MRRRAGLRQSSWQFAGQPGASADTTRYGARRSRPRGSRRTRTSTISGDGSDDAGRCRLHGPGNRNDHRAQPSERSKNPGPLSRPHAQPRRVSDREARRSPPDPGQFTNGPANGVMCGSGKTAKPLKVMVGVAGLEPTTPCPPDRCATGLRYTPTPHGLGALSRRAAPVQVLRAVWPGAGSAGAPGLRPLRGARVPDSTDGS